MSDPEATRVTITALRSAIGITLPDYPSPPVGELVARVIARLEQLIASGAPDSETGDVVDPLIDAWVVEQRAELRKERTKHLRSADDLLNHAEAFVILAQQNVAAAEQDAHDAREYLDELRRTLGQQQQRHRGAL